MANELIERLEAATADDAALMREAWLAVNPEPPRAWNPTPIQQAILDPKLRPAIDQHTAWRRSKERFGAMLWAEAYESAALTLVPEGWSKVIAEKVGLPVQRRWEVWLHDHNTPDGISLRHTEANAPTPALAICIAALRAKDSQ